MPATLTMTQPANLKGHQRTTFTGGVPGKGQGFVPLVVNITVAGTVYVRVRDDTTLAVVQAAQLVGTFGTGSQTIYVPNIDARLGWSRVDLSGDGVTWVLGTNKIGMGDGLAIEGQSLAARKFRRIEGTDTNATLGLTVNPNMSVYAAYTEGTGVTPAAAAWAVPADGTVYDSCYLTEIGNRIIAKTGVNFFVTGYAKGATGQSTWQPGQQNATDFATVVAAAGGCFRWWNYEQGHSDGVIGTPYAAFKAGMDPIETASQALSSIPFVTIATSIQNIKTTNWGTSSQIGEIRRAMQDWCAAGSSHRVHVPMSDVDVNTSDNTHPTQKGCVTKARHDYRALLPSMAATVSDAGPVFASATRPSGSKDILCTFTLPAAATTLVAVDASLVNLASRFRVFNQYNVIAGMALDATTPIPSITSNTITLRLASLPTGGDAVALDVYFAHDIDTQDAALNCLYDDATDGDGITTGRQVVPNIVGVTAAAPVPVMTLTTTSPTYAAGATGFGQKMTGGRAIDTGFRTPSQAFSYECFLELPTAPASNQFVLGETGAGGIFVDSSGRLCATYEQPTDTILVGPDIRALGRVHVRSCVDGQGASLYVNGDCVAFNTVASNQNGRTQSFGIRLLGTNTSLQLTVAGAAVDEVAVWPTRVNTNTTTATGVFTPPTAPYAGTEGMVFLAHLDGNATRTV